MERTTDATIVAEDLTEGSCAGDSSLEASEAVARFCGEGSLMSDSEDVTHN